VSCVVQAELLLKHVESVHPAEFKQLTAVKQLAEQKALALDEQLARALSLEPSALSTYKASQLEVCPFDEPSVPNAKVTIFLALVDVLGAVPQTHCHYRRW
jgi:hypothetical protein